MNTNIVSFLLFLTFFLTSNQDKNILNKNIQYDNINVDKIILDCMCKNGETVLSDETKIDATVRYIIENIDYYKDKILDSNDYYTYENTLYYNFGKISENDIKEIIKQFFYIPNLDKKIRNYKFYDEGYVYLNFEPVEHVIIDDRIIYDCYLNNSKYNLIVEYNRNYLDIKNYFFVNYVIDKDGKIQNAYIYNSNIK